MIRVLIAILPLLSLLATSGCMSAYKESIGGDPEQVYMRIYFTDFNTAWQAVLEAVKSSRLDVSNRESGFIETRWTDNTDEKNFTESFGTAQAFLKAQYRFKINLSKGFYLKEQKPGVKVSVQKEQLVERDVLEPPRQIETDGIEEHTLLYRIGRIIMIRQKIAAVEEQKINKEIQAPSP